MWWEDRNKFPSAFGVLRTKTKPGSPDANIAVPGGSDEVWQLAAKLIAEYEQNLHRQNNPNFHLRRIRVLEGLSSLITLCPSPQLVSAASAPKRFCSLGVCVPHGFIGEIWYLLRVETAGNAFYWRLDTTERFVPWFRLFFYGLWGVWFLALCFIATLLLTLGGMYPIMVLLIPVGLLYVFLTRGSKETPSDWGILIWPLRLFEKSRQERLEHSLAYAPAISGALQEAVDAVERSSLPKQGTNTHASPRVAPAYQQTPAPTAVQGKLRK